MPRIDPAELISCLAILLNRNGGINSTREVVRIARLMARYSKKLVSKCIYVSVLKSTQPELQDEFLSAGGFELVTDWLTEGVANDNWPLCKEVLILLHNLPISARKLINEGGDMAKKASKCSTLSNLECRSLCSELMKKWGLALTEYLNGDIESASRFLNYSLAELPLPIPVVPSVPESSPEHKSESDEELLPILDFYPKHGNKKGKKKRKKPENVKEKIMAKQEEVFKGTVPILKIVRESGKLATTLKSRARPSSTSAFPGENLESSSLEQLPVVEVDKGLPVVEVDLFKTDMVVQNKAKESRKGKLGQINVFEDEDEKFLRKPAKRKPKNEQEKGKKMQKRAKKEEENSEEEESEEEEEVKPKKGRDKSKKAESKSKKIQKKAKKEEESLNEEEEDSEKEDEVKPKKGRGKPKKVGEKPNKTQKKAKEEDETSEENESEEDIEETTKKGCAKPKKPVGKPKRMKKKITEEKSLEEGEKPKKGRVKPKNVDGKPIKIRKKANKVEEKSSEEESDEDEETLKKIMGKPKNSQKRAKRKEETSEEESEEEIPKKEYKKSKKGEDNTKNVLKITRKEEESLETDGEISKKDEKGPLKFRKLEIRLFKDSENLKDDQDKSLKDLQQVLKAMDKLKKDCEEIEKQPEKSIDEEEKLKKKEEYSKKAEPKPKNELDDVSVIGPKDVQKEKEAKEAKKVEDKTKKVSVDKILEKEECKTDKDSENKVDKKSEGKLDKKLENKTEKKSEEQLDKKLENKIDQKSEEKIDKKMEDKTAKKLEEKTDKKSEEKTDNRSEEKTDQKSENKTDNKVDKKSEDIKCEKKVEELRSDKKETYKKEEIKNKVKDIKDKMIAEKESSKKEKSDSTSKRDDKPAKKEDYRSEKSSSKEKMKSLKEKQSEIDKRTLESLGMLARTNFSSLKIPRKSKPDEVKDEGIQKSDKVEEKKPELSKTKDITLERKSAPVKVFNSKFRSHGCEEIAPPAPKKTINKEPLPLKPVLKRPPANGDDIPPIKKLKSPLALLEVEEGKQVRPGGIKLINPRPMFTDSSLFMDAISAGTKPEKKRKLKPNESEKEHKKEEVTQEKRSIKPEEPEVSPKEEEKMDTTPAPVKPQFKFYKDILEEDEEDNDEKPLAQIKREQEEKMKELEKETVTVEEVSEEVKKEPEIIEEKEQKEVSPLPDLPSIEIGDLPPAPPINFGSVFSKDIGKKGVLVYHRTSKIKKSVRWKIEEDLKEFFYFDLDETERVNVNRLKFQDMKQADKLMEKELAKSCVEERLPWRLMVCDIPEGQLNFVHGMNSEEKIIQSEHEANTLASFYFNKNMIPFSPMEPSPEIRTERSVTSEIPLEEIDPSPDNLYDYSHTGWPAAKVDLVVPEMFLPHHELPGPMPQEHQMPLNPAFFPQMGGMPPMAGPSHPRLQGPPGHFGGHRPPFPVQNYPNGDTWMTGDGSMFVEPQMGPDMRMPHGMPIHPPDAAHAYRPLRPWRRDPGNWNREPPKRMPSPAPCVHFRARGGCRFGNRCFYLH